MSDPVEFSGKYLEFDENGRPRAIRCMRCGAEVAGLQPIRDHQGKLILVTDRDGTKHAMSGMMRYSNYSQVELVMKHKNDADTEVEFTCSPIVCADCKPLITDEHKDALWDCVKAGWVAQDVAIGKTKKEAEDKIKDFKTSKPDRVK